MAALSEMAITDGGDSIETTRKNMITKIGENMQVRRFQRIEAKGQLGSYKHGSRIGVVVDLEGGDDELAKDIAMHIAASNPTCVSEEQVPAEMLEKEKKWLPQFEGKTLRKTPVISIPPGTKPADAPVDPALAIGRRFVELVERETK